MIDITIEEVVMILIVDCLVDHPIEIFIEEITHLIEEIQEIGIVGMIIEKTEMIIEVEEIDQIQEIEIIDLEIIQELDIQVIIDAHQNDVVFVLEQDIQLKIFGIFKIFKEVRETNHKDKK